MKNLLSLVIALAVATCTLAQYDSGRLGQKPLTAPAFRKMMRQHYSFTVIGSQTPATGFKIETAKPAVTIKGNVFSSKTKDVIANLELTGGLNEGMMTLFSGNEIDGYLKGSLGLNFLLPYNAARFRIDPKSKWLLLKAVEQNKEVVAKQLDTLVLLKQIVEASSSATTAFEHIVAIGVRERNDLKYTMASYARPAVTSDYMSGLLINLLRKYGFKVDSTTHALTYQKFRTCLIADNCDSVKGRKLVDDMNALDKLMEEENYLDEKQWNYEIEAFNSFWPSKRITLINVSAFGANNTFHLYQANSLLDTSSFLPGISVSYNFFRKWKEAHRFMYLKVGAGVQRVNSLADLPKMDYKKEDAISVTPSEKLVKQKTGTAYIGDLSHSTGYSVFGEVYMQPWPVDYIPGVYTRLEYRYGKAWINNQKLCLDLGIVWNITNGDGESRNLLSVVPYVSWSNLLKEYSNTLKTEEKKTSDLFSVGIKFGVPVNLGRGSK